MPSLARRRYRAREQRSGMSSGVTGIVGWAVAGVKATLRVSR
jgi:hypothetical protein